MASHDEVFSLLPAYAIDAVDDGDRARVRAHLEGCETCQIELTALESDVAAFDRSSDAPTTLWPKLLAEFRRRFSE